MEENREKKILTLMEKENIDRDKAEALIDKYNGDLIEALIYCEREKHKTGNESSEKINQNEFINYIKELIKSGNVARLIIRKEDNALVNIPVNAGIVVGIVMLLQPVLLVLGAATAVFTKLEIDIIKKDGSVEVVNKLVKSTVENGAKVAAEVGHELKERFSVGYEKFKDRINEMKNKR